MALVGNAAEHSTAVVVALKNKMDLAYGIAVGSSLQIALLVAPLLVFASYLFGAPLDLIFIPFEVAAVTILVLIVGFVAMDGESNWMEGPDSECLDLLANLAFFAQLSVSELIHVDDFRGVPQIRLLRLRQRFHPVFFRLLTELSRLCRNSHALLGRT